MNSKTYLNPPYLINLKGRQYMTVAGRIIWFRETHPAGSISTSVKSVGELIIVSAEIKVDGQTLATGLATVRSGAGTQWNGREIEKAETASVGRALAHAGFGTQFATDEMDDRDYLADTPVNLPTPPNPKVELWNKIRVKQELLEMYGDESAIGEQLRSYDGDPVADGYANVVEWLMNRR